jgi:hypothetical protein
MKQVSTLFDALRNEKFAIAVKDDYGIKYYGYEGQGKEWANWANKVEVKSLEESQIPAGIIQGPYKNTSDTELKSLILTFGYGDVSASNFVASKSYRHAGSIRIKTASIVPAVIDTPINYFTGYQYSPAISYKCLYMRQSIKEGSIAHEAKVNNYAFNFQKWMYNANPSTPQSKSLRQRFDSNVGRSSERRLGMKIKSALINSQNIRTKTGIIDSLETKSLGENIEFKALGERLSGGTRLARRAGRAAMARFDPKAWDGDGDGIVQEGTPYQRPAVPGVNDRATGGAVDARAATRAWQGFSSASGRTSPTRVAGGKPLQAPKDAPSRARTPGGKPRLENVKPIASRSTPVAEQGRGVSRRVSTARTERQVQGFASRGKATARKRPGVDKVKDTDGQIFNGLDDAQKATVVENLKDRYEQIQKTIKRELGDEYGSGTWWGSFLAKTGKVGSKTDADSKPWSEDSRISGEALRSFELAVEAIIEDIDSDLVAANNALQAAQSSPTPTNPKTLKSLENKVKKLESEKRTLLDDLQDLKVFDSMFETDNWELMEHLTARSRNQGLGRNAAGSILKGTKDPFEGKTRPKIDWKAPSSFFTEYEQYKEGKRAVVGKGKSGKLKEFADRLFANAEAAKAKRELRRQRRGIVRGLGEDRPGAPGAKERARRALARTGRRLKRKLKGGPSADDVMKEIESTKSSNPTIFGNGKGGVPKVDEKGIQKLAILFRGKDDPRALELLQEQKGQNAGKELGNVWTAQGYNALATPITEADAEFLAGQGWKVIQRGHGTPPPPANNEAGAIGWIKDYIEDPERFITGEGGAVYGPGEYWARPGTNWDGYLAYEQGTLALISPDTRVLTITEAAKLQAEHRKIWSEVHKALSGIGGGTQGAKDLDPQDLVKELKAEILKAFADGDPIWQTEAGQLLSNMFKYMETAPPEMRQELWDALKYMESLASKDEHYAAMIYGYDGVDHEGNSPIVWFNRGALAIVDGPMKRGRMKEIYDIQRAS